MAPGIVVLSGDLAVDHGVFDPLVAEFGWSFKEAHDLCSLAELNARQDLVTVLFSPKNLALPWQQALRAVLDAAPKALPILCHSFAEVIDWPQVAEAGAYYSLLMPFNVSEFRQSLGFVRSARQRHGDATVRFDATHRDLGDITHLHSAVIAQTREAARP